MAKIRPGSIIIFLLILFLIKNIHAKNDEIGFADFLFSKQQYYRAITEYERFIYHNPKNNLVDKIAYKIGLCYFYGQQYNDAISYFYNYLEDYENSQYKDKALFKIVESYYVLQNYDDAIFELNEYYNSTKDNNMKLYSKFFIGKLYFYKYNWEKAYKIWNDTEKEFSIHLTEVKNLCKKAEDIPSKNPVVAGGLSILFPGLGQIYNGDYGDALAVFLVNSIFGYLVYDAYVEKNYVRLGIWGILEIGWYSGTVYGAIRGAQRYNLRHKEEFVKSVEINIHF